MTSAESSCAAVRAMASMDIGGWHDKQVNGLAFLFREGDHTSEQQLFVACEEMVFGNTFISGVGSL